MSWFFIALIGPLFYAFTNHIDKYLLSKYFKEGGVGTLLIFSSLATALALPFLYFLSPDVFSIGLANMALMFLVGVLYTGVLFFYLKALEDDEASVAIVFYQLVPVFAYVLGYFILGELLSQTELLAMAIIILGASIISFEMDTENGFVLRKKTITYMLIAALCWAAASVLFKFVALEENVWRTLFWEHLALTVIGIILLYGVKSYREHFVQAFTTNSKAILSLNVTSEVLYMLGNIALSYAYLLAPVALVLLADSFQPIFVLAIGIILTMFFPQIASEKIEAKHLWQKVFAVIITCIGTYLLLS